MNMVLLAGAGCVTAAALAFYFLFRRIFTRRALSAAEIQWCRDFSVGKYRPMLRLLNSDDSEFLARQPGFHPRLAKRLRAARRRVVYQYLRLLTRDFDRLCCCIRLLVACSEEDGPDLVLALVGQRLTFWYRMLAARWALTLDWAGLGGVDLGRVLRPIESLRWEFNRRDPAPVESRA